MKTMCEALSDYKFFYNGKHLSKNDLNNIVLHSFYNCLQSIPPNENKYVNCVHIIPIYGMEHLLSGNECSCSPEIERFENGNYLITHREDN